MRPFTRTNHRETRGVPKRGNLGDLPMWVGHVERHGQNTGHVIEPLDALLRRELQRVLRARHIRVTKVAVRCREAQHRRT
eukprot:24968-Eustigmatos_ZCMA.PRE.1